ncbi:very short patch repair endonuclease [Amycolatopsis sp.]|uniref:very short patch repair endonuclease n=1 Tax=Amycolatopsis sp. TaxID=37632 RepID=UPI002E0AFD51|nr:very short patch repair endonuclease [Amycolatopsis sp.]
MADLVRAKQNTWKGDSPADRAWKGRAGLSREARTAEQDRAARGRYRRSVDLGDGRLACASVELKVLPNTRRIRAYLRWSDGGRSPARYLGEVDKATRAANLAEGWKCAWEKGLLCDVALPEHSWASSPAVRASMRGNKGRDTKPEKYLRSLLHREGLRYRVSFKPLSNLRRTADIVFRRARLAIFIDGCYWHGCPEHYRPSKKNSDFWRKKIENNQRRDMETNSLLIEAGWTVIRLWEHEDLDLAAGRIVDLVRSRTLAPRSLSSGGMAVE